MKKQFAVILALLTFIFGKYAKAQEAQCIYAEHKSAVVSVEYSYTTKSDGSAQENGTGFIVSSSGYVLTNAHVIRPEIRQQDIVLSSIKVRVGGRSYDQITATVSPQDIDESADLALIKLPVFSQTPWPTLPIGNIDTLPVGSGLVGLGYPVGGDIAIVPLAPKTADTAIVDGVPKAWWQTNLALSKGNSGGPIFGQLGTVVGVAVAINRNSNHLTYVIPISRAQSLLQKAGVRPIVSGICADFPSCSHPSHGIDRYTVNENLGDESEWRYGGGNPKANQGSWCSDYLGELQKKYPKSSFTKTTSRERQDWDNAALRIGAKYKYYCEYKRLEGPIYKEQKSAACLK